MGIAIGIILIVVGIIIFGLACEIIVEDTMFSYDDEFWAPAGGVLIIIGIVVLILAMFLGSVNKTTNVKEVAKIDSTHIITKKPIEHQLKLVITQSDYNGVFCGRNIQIVGHDSLNQGDTLTINIK